MKLLDRLLAHDVWTTRKLLEIAEKLTDEQLDREFDIAHRNIRATFEHIIYNLEAWSDCIAGRTVRAARGQSISALTARLERAADDFAELSRSVAEREAWDDLWLDPHDRQRRSYGGTIAHVITHSMHHRAQLLYMLRLVGITDLPEGDVLSWEAEARSR